MWVCIAPCVTYNDECVYDTARDRRRPVSKAYVAALEDRVAWMERRLGDFDEGGRGGRMGGQETAERSEETMMPHHPNQSAVSSPEHEFLQTVAAASQPVERLQIDNTTGEVREYGPTSMFKHLNAPDGLPSSPSQSLPLSSDTGLHNLEYGSDIEGVPSVFDDAMHRQALHMFFTFFNPWCWWVNEEEFRNDLGTTDISNTGLIMKRSVRTANYSPLLHLAVLAIGVMYLRDLSYLDRKSIADSLARKAVTMFEEEIESARLSSVIGMMLLGTHHAGHARQSLGYVYSGNGLRLTRILGLGIDASTWVDRGLITLDTKRWRDRVYHTAFIQDKLWSTYVGRAPAPNLCHWRMPSPTIDAEEDARPWMVGLESPTSDTPPSSWIASTFTWTTKLARIIELILTNIYSTRRDAHSESGRNARLELSVLLEKWNAELPEPLRISPSMYRSGQVTSTLLPHILTLNMMFHFAVILLNRPDYCDIATPHRPRSMRDSEGTAPSVTATERCDQAAIKVLRLAQLFDQSYGLSYAPVSLTQFTFTAGTIHLLGAANNSNSDNGKVTFVTDCISVLRSIGETWKCALQSADVLQRLLHDCLGTSKKVPGLEGHRKAPAGAIDIQEILQSDPNVAQQLEKLGWAPPQRLRQETPVHSGPFPRATTPTTRTSIFQGDPPADHQIAVAHHTVLLPDTEMGDARWTSPLASGSTWNDDSISYTPNFFPIEDQSLLEMLLGNNGMAPDAWANHFNEAAGDAWPPGWAGEPPTTNRYRM